MRLLDGDVVTGLRLPVGGEGLVEVDVELARRVVGDVEEFDGLGVGSGGKREGDGGEKK